MKNKSEILLRGNDVVCPLKIPSFFSQKVENYKKIRYNKRKKKQFSYDGSIAASLSLGFMTLYMAEP